MVCSNLVTDIRANLNSKTQCASMGRGKRWIHRAAIFSAECKHSATAGCLAIIGGGGGGWHKASVSGVGGDPIGDATC